MRSQKIRLVMSLAGALASGAALAATPGTLPPAKHQGSVAFLTGGVGQRDAKAFERAAPHFPLALEFVNRVGKRDEFLAGVNVKVAGPHGKALISTKTDGPFLLAKVPSGHYSVTANYDGKTIKRAVDVKARSGHPLVMEWKGAA